jgi:hypothetical protein
VNSSDGKFYRWYLPTDTLSESVTLTSGYLQPYTMTIVGVDGTIYGIQIGQLFAFGKTPGLSVSDVSLTEGTGGTVNATFTVSLDFPRTDSITVNYATADGTAKAGSDYTAKSGSLTFNPGDKSKTVTVTVTSDSLDELDETFFLNLTSPINAVVVDGQGQATIVDDDPGTPPRVTTVLVNNGEIQRTNVNKVTVQFDQFVTLPTNVADAFQLTRQSDNLVVGLVASVDNSGPGTKVNLTFNGPSIINNSLADGRYTLKVLASQIPNLDGDGNSVGGDDYVLVSSGTNGVFRLFGDGNGDGSVNSVDFAMFRTVFGTAGVAFDYDGDGQQNANDFAEFRKRFGLNLP